MIRTKNIVYSNNFLWISKLLLEFLIWPSPLIKFESFNLDLFFLFRGYYDFWEQHSPKCNLLVLPPFVFSPHKIVLAISFGGSALRLIQNVGFGQPQLRPFAARKLRICLSSSFSFGRSKFPFPFFSFSLKNSKIKTSKQIHPPPPPPPPPTPLNPKKKVYGFQLD